MLYVNVHGIHLMSWLGKNLSLTNLLSEKKIHCEGYKILHGQSETEKTLLIFESFFHDFAKSNPVLNRWTRFLLILTLILTLITFYYVKKKLRQNKLQIQSVYLVKQLLVMSPFYRWINWGTMRAKCHILVNYGKKQREIISSTARFFWQYLFWKIVLHYGLMKHSMSNDQKINK